MKSLTLFFAALLAASPADASGPGIPQTGTTEYINDGSFESIAPDGGYCEGGGTYGNWTVTNQACFVIDEPTETPYGKNYLNVFSYPPVDSNSSLIQYIHGLSTAHTFTLSYAYVVQANPAKNCTLTASLGPQLISTLVLPSNYPSSEKRTWMNVTHQFVPAQASGNLTFHWACPRPSKPQWAYGLDIVSLLGPAKR